MSIFQPAAFAENNLHVSGMMMVVSASLPLADKIVP